MSSWDTIHLGGWPSASVTAVEAAALASETRQPVWATGAILARALIAAVRGAPEEAHQRFEEAERIIFAGGMVNLLSVAAPAWGVAALAPGRPEEAFERLLNVYDGCHWFTHLERVWGISYLAEAATRAGEPQAADSVVAQVEGLAEINPSIGLRVAATCARALLAMQDEADDRFAVAMAGPVAMLPFHRARLQLAGGRYCDDAGGWRRREVLCARRP